MYLHPYKALEILRPLFPEITLKEVSLRYQKIFRSIRPDPKIAEYIPNMNDVYGVHLRKGDKIPSDFHINFCAYTPFCDVDMSSISSSSEEFISIIKNLLFDLKNIIESEQSPKFFIASDDSTWRYEIIQKMKTFGKFKLVEIDYENLGPGMSSTVDLFSLSRCKTLFMGIGYSVFTISAAIIGDVPLITYVDKACMTPFRSCVSFNGQPKNYEEFDVSGCGGWIKSNIVVQ
jgi:hypothetical protein